MRVGEKEQGVIGLRQTGIPVPDAVGVLENVDVAHR
jgi:hypothetical protein